MEYSRIPTMEMQHLLDLLCFCFVMFCCFYLFFKTLQGEMEIAQLKEEKMFLEEKLSAFQTQEEEILNDRQSLEEKTLKLDNELMKVSLT